MTAMTLSGSRRSALTELVRAYPLLVSLTWRDLQVRYTQSFLGLAWAVMLPLSMMAVFTFVFAPAMGDGVIKTIGMPYALYAYAGLVPWVYFSSSVTNAMNSLVNNRNLVTKVYFPREVLPLSSIAASGVDFLVALIVLAGLAFYFHVQGHFSPPLTGAVFFFPIIVATQIAWTAGLGLGLSALHLFYRDVRPVFTVVLQLWMFVSAVVVPVPSGDTLLGRVCAWNPLVGLITAYRECLLFGRFPDPGAFSYAACTALLILIVGWYGFRRAAHMFAERI